MLSKSLDCLSFPSRTKYVDFYNCVNFVAQVYQILGDVVLLKNCAIVWISDLN